MADDEKKPFHNPFAALAGLKDKLPEGKTPKQVAEIEKKRPARAVVRLERTGRSGKEVTIVSHLELPVMEREVWLKALKSGLGCGGSIEGDALVLQGDQRERLPALLEKRGVKKITVAN
jgi:translation initiation factor 1